MSKGDYTLSVDWDDAGPIFRLMQDDGMSDPIILSAGKMRELEAELSEANRRLKLQSDFIGHHRRMRAASDELAEDYRRHWMGAASKVEQLQAELAQVKRDRDNFSISSEMWYQDYKTARGEIGEARREAVKWYLRCLEVLQSVDTWPYDARPLYCLTCGLTLDDSMICKRCGKDR